jgi:hypothetical protein
LDSLQFYDDYIKKNSKYYYGTQFKFDKQGKVLEKKGGWSDEGYNHKTIYKYNSLGQPTYVQTVFHSDSTDIGYRNYFYTNGKLDSVFSQMPIMYGGVIDPEKMYYDDRGLCYRQVRPRGDIINCIYKQRK